MRHSRTPRSLMAAAAAVVVAVALVAAPSPAGAATSLEIGNTAPTAKITYPSGQVYAGDTVTFSGTESSDRGGKIEAYAWSVSGPGAVKGSASGQTAAVTFSQPGTVKVTLTVTDNGLLNGLLTPLLGPQQVKSATTSVSIKAIARPNRPPVITHFVGSNAAPTAYFISNSVGFKDPDGDDVDIVSISCANCRGEATFSNGNTSGIGVPDGQQFGSFFARTPCYQQNIGINFTIDDGHGHQVTGNRTIVVYNGGQTCT